MIATNQETPIRDLSCLKLGARAYSLYIYASDARPAGEILVRIALRGSVAGRVIDEQGEGVADVPVQLFAKGQSNWNKKKANYQSARSDSQGRSLLQNVDPGEYCVTTQGTAFARSESPSFLVESAKKAEEVPILVTEARGLAVRVTNAEGQPIQDLEIDLYEYEKGINRTRYFIQSARTDDEGWAALSQFGRRCYSLGLKELAERGWFLAKLQDREVTDDEARVAEKHLRLVKAHYLRGQIVVQEQRPLNRRFVTFAQLSDSGDWVPTEYGDCDCDPDGYFERAVRDVGTYRVHMVAAPAFGPSRNYEPEDTSQLLVTDVDAGLIRCRPKK